MKVKLANEMGFCYGVRRAIRLLEIANHQHQKLYTLGHVVHNKQVVERLAAKGISPVDSIDKLNGSVVAITTHGVGPKVLNKIQGCSLQIVDTTCPWVNRAQKAAKKLTRAGFSVIIFGDANHPEVKGVLEWAGEGGRVVQEPGLKKLYTQFPRRLGILSQTTQSPLAFKEFAKKVVDEFLPSGIEICIINTICDATQKRQTAAIELANAVDIIIVIGSKDSANTRRLTEICRALGVDTYQVETARDLQTAWFKGKDCVGVTAGASTPDEAIKEVVDKLKI